MFYDVFDTPRLRGRSIDRKEVKDLRVLGKHIDKLRDVLPSLACRLSTELGVHKKVPLLVTNSCNLIPLVVTWDSMTWN